MGKGRMEGKSQDTSGPVLNMASEMQAKLEARHEG